MTRPSTWLAGALVALAAVFATQPAATAAATDEPALVVAAAYGVQGVRYGVGKEGPTRFDCSGLVWWTFSTTGLGDRIGGARMLAREYQRWQRARGLLYTAPAAVRIGDLAYWGAPAVHVGIVTRIVHAARKPRVRVFVTSATTTLGVREVRVDRLVAAKPFSGYGHVDLRYVPDPTPTPTPPPTPTPLPTPEPTPSIEPATPAPTDAAPTPAPTAEVVDN